jgi:hypothetical protein
MPTARAHEINDYQKGIADMALLGGFWSFDILPSAHVATASVEAHVYRRPRHRFRPPYHRRAMCAFRKGHSEVSQLFRIGHMASLYGRLT